MKLRCVWLVLFCTACAAEEPVATLIDELPAQEKVDAPLRAAARSDMRVPVLVLARHQLFSGAGAFTDFTARNASADRLQLRRSVVADLKRIADDDRRALVEAAWPAAARATPLWIINAVVAQLTREEIERAAANPAVAYLYLLQRQLPPATPSGTAVVVTPTRTPFSANGKKVSWNLESIGAPAAWARGVTGEGAVVALIDAAVALTHRDLANNVWVNEDDVPNNGQDDDRNGYVDDRHGYDFSTNSPNVGRVTATHGTFVAGILAGDGSGGTITGVAPRARIMPLVGNGFLEVALAYQYALENGADVVNMSFSTPNQGNLRGAWRMASDHATAAGLVLVSGAGNFQQTERIPVQLRIPEDIPSVIAAGGVDQSLRVTPFSSLGPVEWGSVRFYGDHALPNGLTKPDVVGFPGAGYPILNPAGGYIDPNNTVLGNSFSSPHVGGAAALLLSANPRLTAWRVKEILEQTARDLGTPGKDNQTGFGLIDLSAALNRAAR